METARRLSFLRFRASVGRQRGTTSEFIYPVTRHIFAHTQYPTFASIHSWPLLCMHVNLLRSFVFLFLIIQKPTFYNYHSEPSKNYRSWESLDFQTLSVQNSLRLQSSLLDYEHQLAFLFGLDFQHVSLTWSWCHYEQDFQYLTVFNSQLYTDQFYFTFQSTNLGLVSSFYYKIATSASFLPSLPSTHELKL